MNTKILAVVAVIIMVAAGIGIAFAVGNNHSDGEIEIQNTNGTTTTIKGVANKVVLLNVNTVEAAIMLGADEQIVGVGSAAYKRADIKAELTKAENAGSSTEPNIDKVNELKPDLIVGFSTMKIKNQAELEALGYPVAYLDCYIPGQMEKDIGQLAKALGKTSNMEKYTKFVKEKIDLIKSMLPSGDLMVNKFYVEFTSVTYTSGYPSQNKGTSSDIILEDLGFVNVMHNVKYGAYVQADAIQTSGATKIVKIYDISGNYDSVKSELKSRDAFVGTPAKTNDQMYMMFNNIAYGPRCFCAYAMFAKMAYPTEFESVNVSDWLKDYNTTFDVNFGTDNTFVKI